MCFKPTRRRGPYERCARACGMVIQEPWLRADVLLSVCVPRLSAARFFHVCASAIGQTSERVHVSTPHGMWSRFTSAMYACPQAHSPASSWLTERTSAGPGPAAL